MDKKKIGLWVAGLVVGGVILLTVVGSFLAEPTDVDELVEAPEAPVDDPPEEVQSPPEPEPAENESEVPQAPRIASDELLREAIREARKAVLYPNARYAAAIYTAGQAVQEDSSSRGHAYEASRRASEASVDSAVALEELQVEFDEIEAKSEEIQMRFVRHERDWEIKQRDSKALSMREDELEAERRSIVESRNAAYREAADAWTALLPEALHDHAASEAAKSVGRNPGWFGAINHVYTWFLIETRKLTPITPVLHQKECFDYGVAMLTYFDLNPIGDHEDEYNQWKRTVRSRLETLGWMNGSPKFERLRY